MSEKFALVTGTSRGLGEAMANYLLDQGYTVFGFSRSGCNIDHGHYIDIQGDVREEAEVEAMYEVIQQTTNHLDLVVLNAGILTLDSVFETSVKDFKNNLETNVMGPFLVLKHLADFILEHKTHVVAISSIAAKKAFPNMSAYTASKFALEGLIQTCKQEWNELGVRFSVLYPGAIDTGLWQEVELGETTDKMMSIEDFLFAFDGVLKAPHNLQFSSLVFGHAEGLGQ